ncbi:MAG: M23 family metallopeptidase [bacterium]
MVQKEFLKDYITKQFVKASLNYGISSSDINLRLKDFANSSRVFYTPQMIEHLKNANVINTNTYNALKEAFQDPKSASEFLRLDAGTDIRSKMFLINSVLDGAEKFLSSQYPGNLLDGVPISDYLAKLGTAKAEITSKVYPAIPNFEKSVKDIRTVLSGIEVKNTKGLVSGITPSKELKDIVKKKVDSYAALIDIAKKQLETAELKRQAIIDKFNRDESIKLGKLKPSSSIEEISIAVNKTNNVTLKRQLMEMLVARTSVDNRLLTNQRFVTGKTELSNKQLVDIIRNFEDSFHVQPENLPLTGIASLQKEIDDSVVKENLVENKLGKKAIEFVAKEAVKGTTGTSWRTIYDQVEKDPRYSTEFRAYFYEFSELIRKGNYASLTKAFEKSQLNNSDPLVPIVAKAARKRAYEDYWENTRGASVMVMEKSALEGTQDSPLIPYFSEIVKDEGAADAIGFTDTEKIIANPVLKDRIEGRLRKKLYAHEIGYRLSQEVSNEILSSASIGWKLAKQKLKDPQNPNIEITFAELISREVVKTVAEDAATYFDTVASNTDTSLLDARSGLIKYLTSRGKDPSSVIGATVAAQVKTIVRTHSNDFFTDLERRGMSPAEQDTIIDTLANQTSETVAGVLECRADMATPESFIEVKVLDDKDREANKDNAKFEVTEVTLAKLPYGRKVVREGQYTSTVPDSTKAPLSRLEKAHEGVELIRRTVRLVELPTNEKLTEAFQRVGLQIEEAEDSSKYIKKKYAEQGGELVNLRTNDAMLSEYDNQLITSLFTGNLIPYLDKKREDGKQKMLFDIISNLIGRTAGNDIQRLFELHENANTIGEIINNPEVLRKLIWEKGILLPKVNDGTPGGRMVGVRGRLINLFTRSIGLRKKVDMGGGQRMEVNLITYGIRNLVNKALDKVGGSRVGKFTGWDKTLAYENRRKKKNILDLGLSLTVRFAYTMAKKILGRALDVAKKIPAVAKAYASIFSKLSTVTDGSMAIRLSRIKGLAKVGGAFGGAGIRSLQSGLIGGAIGGLIAGPVGGIIGSTIFGGEAFVNELLEGNRLERILKGFLGVEGLNKLVTVPGIELTQSFKTLLDKRIYLPPSISSGLTSSWGLEKFAFRPGFGQAIEITGYKSYIQLSAGRSYDFFKQMNHLSGLEVVPVFDVADPTKILYYKPAPGMYIGAGESDLKFSIGSVRTSAEFRLTTLDGLPQSRSIFETSRFWRAYKSIFDKFDSWVGLKGSAGRLIRELNVIMKGKFSTYVALGNAGKISRLAKLVNPKLLQSIFSVGKSSFIAGLATFFLTGGNPVLTFAVIGGNTLAQWYGRRLIEKVTTAVESVAKTVASKIEASSVGRAIAKLVKFPIFETLGLGYGTYRIWETVDQVISEMQKGNNLFQAVGSLFNNPLDAVMRGIDIAGFPIGIRALTGTLTALGDNLVGSLASTGLISGTTAANVSFSGVAPAAAVGSVLGSLLGGLLFGFTPGVMVVSGLVGAVVGGVVGVVVSIAAGPIVGFIAGATAGTIVGGTVGGYLGKLLDGASKSFGDIVKFLGAGLGLLRFIRSERFLDKVEAIMSISMSLTFASTIVGVGLVAIPSIFSPGVFVAASKIAGVTKAFNSYDKSANALVYTVTITKGNSANLTGNIIVDFTDTLSSTGDVSRITFDNITDTFRQEGQTIKYHAEKDSTKFTNDKLTYRVFLNKNLNEVAGGNGICNLINGNSSATRMEDGTKVPITEAINQNVCVNKDGQLIRSSSLAGLYRPDLGGNPVDPKAAGVVVTQCSNGAFSHQGERAIDIAAPAGTPVFAWADGKVSLVQIEGRSGVKYGFGSYVQIQSTVNGVDYITTYGHMLTNIKDYVIEGKLVKKGDQIGQVGSTGNSTGNHLHFAIKSLDPKALGPANYVPREPCCHISCSSYSESGLGSAYNCTNILSEWTLRNGSCTK